MKRGQAATEFVMTYGWAILVVLVAIGALAYFGVMSPNRSLPPRCSVASGFGCDEYVVRASAQSTQLQLVMRNSLGESIKITGFEANTSNGAGTLSCDYPASSVTIDTDAAIPLSCNLTGVTTSGVAKVQFSLHYRKTEGAYDRVITGEVYGTAEKVECVDANDCTGNSNPSCESNKCVYEVRLIGPPVHLPPVR